MRRTRSFAALVGITAALGLTACGADDPATTAAPGPSAPPATGGHTADQPTAGASLHTSTGTGSAAPSRAPAPTEATGDTTVDCAARPGTVPEGTWSGPLTMDVDGRGGDARFASSRGRGTLRLVVADGRVASGSWSVTWRSRGSADTGQAAATLTLRGRIAGSARGPASRPALVGTWSLAGQVHVTKPVDQRSPVSETGTGTEPLRVTEVSCAEVTGTFAPTFTSKEAAATFTGRATWVGTPVG